MISVNNPRNAVFVPVTRRQFSLWWLRSRSAPVTLQVLGTGAAPRGEKAPGPWLVRAPENHRYPAQVQVVHGSAQRRAVCSQISGLRSSRAQPTRSGSLAGASRSHTLSLHGCRDRGGNASGLNQIWWLIANPVSKLTEACPVRFRRRRGPRRSRCRRAECGSRRVPACGRPP